MSAEPRDESSGKSVQRDVAIYVGSRDPDLDSEAFEQWAMRKVVAAWRDLG